MELDGVTTLLAEGSGEEARRKTTGGMLDFEQQTNQALASLDDDWHLLEGECTTFAIFPLFSLSSRPLASEGARKPVGRTLLKIQIQATERKKEKKKVAF